MPIISVIVPVYKVEKFLDRCVESLVNQTLRDIEIILVDDLSPDNCPQMCDAWAGKDSRIKVVHKLKNEGLGLARNSGIDVAKGQYVAFVDSDDFVDPDMYENIYKIATEKFADLVVCGLRYITINGTIRDFTYVKTYLEKKGDEISNYIFDMIACAPYEKKERLHEMSACRVLYRKDIIDSYHLRFRSEREVVSEDLVFNIQYLQHSNSLISMPQAFYNYCQNNSSTSSVFKKEKFARSIYLHKVVLELIGDSEEAKLRADRMLIGYFRDYMLTLVGADVPDKLGMIKQTLKDPIFLQLKNSYRSRYLPSYHKELYWMQVNNHPVMAFLLTTLIVKFKKLIAVIHLR